MKQSDTKTSTRQQMLMLLKTNGSMSAAQLAVELNMTEMGVRRHLYSLEEEGMLEIEMVRQPMGRPLRTYRLSTQGDEQFPKQYHQLILDLLREMEVWPEEEGIGKLFESRKQSLIEKYAPQMGQSSLDERVEALGTIQDNNGYMVETEREEDGSWLLHEYNCPIAQVAQHYKQPCACELALFRELLDADVTRIECIAEQGKRCTYRIRKQI
ncbi:transcriptional regulator [Paenibacillus dendritiformis]|uniref:helix-turn-helix transcriptional regulator n=1 Tax=Paenibacillus dendritiformis TaxID=130049 RepID=UPI00143D11C8|nr:metalloregulator ArsR/SmtB family transcription factor [Paenibacillus dendritiformis]NKI22585.1 transcriptional regulator [Paenibacillus dendritiformis]NRF98913.1 transcriptional regulator [Paenibacillus dendritiformis]GIO73215.1 transcriptional regulator [Paenibacillus dendritiformis]